MLNHPSGPDGALNRDDLLDVYENDPTWALLRSYNSRWMLPLFSQHLETADGPVSADWFHQRVAEALVQNDIDAEQGPADYCRGWVDSRWLVRTRASGADSRPQYRLSPQALTALRIVRELVERDNAVSEARLGSIAHAVHQLAALADPSADSQIARIDEQIAELERRRSEIEVFGTEPVSPDSLTRQVREVVRLTASLPADFRQLSSMVEQRHREVARRASVEHVGKGALVEQYLRENDLLEQTPEGRAYRGFAQMLSSREIDAMRADIEQILAQPGAAEHLTDGQRVQLESLISSLLAEEQTVQETYGRWTSSLRRFLTRSSAEKHQRLLTLAERALHAGGVWAERRPGHVMMPETDHGDVLGIGSVDVVDVSQLQVWADRGREAVDVRVAAGDTALPDADRAALRLTAGTSTAAVRGTIDRLLLERETVTSVDVYEATEPAFRRLGLVLSMLDLALDDGLVSDETETVVLTSEGGTAREVTLPRLVFSRDSAPPDPVAATAIDSLSAPAPQPERGTL
ncbi:DUF3375 family protein [Frigoribacterium sp. 2-23]|uniref:DUF3375 family protein n=1 Tax=Frigoribacterium sp. 2-23 TaxID=3415006 RepID=UPI003C6F5AFE